MDHRLTPEIIDESIEDALRTYPVSALPKDFTAAVMSQIQQTSAPRFQITYVDVVLAVTLTIAFVAAWVGLQSLPGPVVLQLRFQGMLLRQTIIVNARWLLPVASIALGSSLGLLALINLRPSRNLER